MSERTDNSEEEPLFHTSVKQEIKIATFGCWNMGCIEYRGQYYVSELIKEKQSELDFMIILGDNYYGSKEEYKNDVSDEHMVSSVSNKKNTKNIFIIDDMKMKQGFTCIDKINLPKKLIMGNHDVTESVDKNCSLVKYQLKIPWYDVKFPFGHDFYYFYNIDKNSHETVLIIYLDTSLYTEKIKDDCYISTTNKNKNTLIQEQESFINNIIDDAYFTRKVKKILLCGHEPLLVFKPKEGKKNKISIIKQLIDIIFKKINDYQDVIFTYICADYHLYQNTKITKNELVLNQFIFGTGGGKLEIAPTSGKKKETEYEYTISIEENIVFNNLNIRHEINGSYGLSAYGYGEITIDHLGISHKFIMIEQQPLFGGKLSNNENNKHKYLKYKNKYLQLKLYT
jgi:hypothetical protein